jgi:DNA-binding NarL/FixJ family response regulator
MSIRVLIADDHQIVRDGLSSLLARHDDIEVIGEAENGRRAIELVAELAPDVAILDIGMPEVNGIDTARVITSATPATRVIMLSMHSDRRYVAEALAAGASGYLVKDSAFDELARALRTVVAGGVYLSPTVTGVVVEDYVKHLAGAAQEPAGNGVLSPREIEVLALLAEGKSTKEIASELYLSGKTVETYRRQIMDKLGIYNVPGLVKYAIRQGLASVDE